MKLPGEQARITYHSTARVREGDYVRTTTGRTYLVVGVRVQMRGKHAGVQHLTTVVMEPDHVPEPDAHVFPVHWHHRGRKPAA